MEEEIQFDPWGLLQQLAVSCPDVALAILNTKIQDTMLEQLHLRTYGTLGNQFLKEIVNAGGVIAGSFVLGALYGSSDKNWKQHDFGDIDIWIDVTTTVQGDPRQLLPVDHPVRNLRWNEDAAEISRFYGCFPAPFPYIANESDDEKKVFNATRFFHPIILILAKYWRKRNGIDLEKMQSDESLSQLRTLDELLGLQGYTVHLNKLGLALWGESHGPEPYAPANHEFDDYEDSITHSFGKTDQGLLATRIFDFNFFQIQLHIVDTKGRGIRKWIQELFDINVCGAVQYDKSGVHFREPLSRILPLLQKKIMSYTSRCRSLDWTPARQDRVRKALEEDNARESLGEPLKSTRLGSVNVDKANYADDRVFPALFEWAKAVLLPPLRTMEDLYERMATTKLNRVAKYHRRGFSMYFPGIYHTGDQIAKIVRDHPEVPRLEKCQAVFQVFQDHVEPTILQRFINLVATDPVKPHNGWGTGPTYFY